MERSKPKKGKSVEPVRASFGGKLKRRNWVILKQERSQSILDFVYGRSSWDSNYLRKLNLFLKGNPTKKRVAIDVGACYGFVSEYLSKRYDEVKAFEIVTPVRDCLNENVKRFENDNVEVFPYGLGEKEGEIDIYFTPSWTGHSSHYRNPDIMAGSGKYESVLKCQIRTLDSFEFDVVDYIKIDVEGLEVQVLRGAIETIKRCRPVITTEINADNPESVRRSVETISMLEGLGYEYQRTIGSDFIWSPKEYGYTYGITNQTEEAE